MPEKYEERREEPDDRLTVPRSEAAQRIQRQIERMRALIGQESAIPPDKRDYHRFLRNFRRWRDHNEELLSRLFTTNRMLNIFFAPQEIDETTDAFNSAFEYVDRLEAIAERLDLIPEQESKAAVWIEPETEALSINSNGAVSRRIFIVHGHDVAMKESVARTIERLKLDAIILHEQANKGRAVIEKFEDYSDVRFAVVLMSPDDVGCAKGTEPNGLQPRARQNVIYELGFFSGKLGRGNVCVLYREGVEIPSDYLGVLYLPYDAAGLWRLALASELRNAGVDVDLNLLAR